MAKVVGPASWTQAFYRHTGIPVEAAAPPVASWWGVTHPGVCRPSGDWHTVVSGQPPHHISFAHGRAVRTRPILYLGESHHGTGSPPPTA